MQAHAHTHTNNTSSTPPNHPPPFQSADRIMEAVAAAVDVVVPESYIRMVAEKEYQEKMLGMVGGWGGGVGWGGVGGLRGGR